MRLWCSCVRIYYYHAHPASRQVGTASKESTGQAYRDIGGSNRELSSFRVFLILERKSRLLTVGFNAQIQDESGERSPFCSLIIRGLHFSQLQGMTKAEFTYDPLHCPEAEICLGLILFCGPNHM